jgi:hypothetical protein
MRSILIVFLIFLILGLYFFTEPTKGIIKVTGKAVSHVTKGVFHEIKDSDEYNDLKHDIINKTKEQLKLGGK